MARTKQMRKGKKIAPQDEATRQARDQFIRDMAAKALANPPIVADSGGIHPSRLARTNGNSKGPLNRGAKKQQANKHSQVQGPPEVRKSGNKRNFEDSDAQNSAPSTASKKQRTKGEPKGPKAPAAVKSESIKGNQRALTEEQKSVVEAEETAKLIKLADKAAQDTTAKEEAKRARKAAKKAAKKPIKDAASDQESTVSTRKNVSESEESIRQMTKEEEKAARKRAKKDAKARKIINEAESREATMQEGLEELKGYELKSEEASAQTGSGPSERVTSGQKLATMTLEEEREARRQKSSELRAIKAARKAKKAQAQAQAAAASDAVDAKEPIKEEKPSSAPTIENPNTSSGWSKAASALGDKASKFMRLLGGAKHGEVPGGVEDTEKGSIDDKVKRAQKAEKDLQKQYMAGVQAKQSGKNRGGLGT